MTSIPGFEPIGSMPVLLGLVFLDLLAILLVFAFIFWTDSLAPVPYIVAIICIGGAQLLLAQHIGVEEWTELIDPSSPDWKGLQDPTVMLTLLPAIVVALAPFVRWIVIACRDRFLGE